MNKELIQILKMEERDFNVLFFDSAVKYAEYYLPEKYVSDCIANPVYWIWYRTQFNAVCRDFLNSNYRHSTKALRAKFLQFITPEDTIAKPSDYVISKILCHAK